MPPTHPRREQLDGGVPPRPALRGRPTPPAAGGLPVRLGERGGPELQLSRNRAIVGAQYTLPWAGTRLRLRLRRPLPELPALQLDLPHQLPDQEGALGRGANSRRAHRAACCPAGFTLAAEYQGIIARSTLPIFSYNRSVFSLIPVLAVLTARTAARTGAFSRYWIFWMSTSRSRSSVVRTSEAHPIARHELRRGR